MIRQSLYRLSRILALVAFLSIIPISSTAAQESPSPKPIDLACATDMTDALTDDLARHVLGECEHTRQFVRFSHMADGSYAASFSPGANTIPRSEEASSSKSLSWSAAYLIGTR